MEKNNIVTIFTEDGKQHELKILFTFHHDQKNRDFVLLYEEDAPDQVYIYEYFEGEDYFDAVEDEEILEEAQELLEAYEEEHLDEIE
jgi:uncharacterized protein YrzB (UPF0473 family)